MEEMKISFYREVITCLKAPLPSLSVQHCSKPANDKISLHLKSVYAKKIFPRPVVISIGLIISSLTPTTNRLDANNNVNVIQQDIKIFNRLLYYNIIYKL
jgi:hypothetical protein